MREVTCCTAGGLYEGDDTFERVTSCEANVHDGENAAPFQIRWGLVYVVFTSARNGKAVFESTEYSTFRNVTDRIGQHFMIAFELHVQHRFNNQLKSEITNHKATCSRPLVTPSDRIPNV